MPYLMHARQLYKLGPYHRLQQTQIYFHYQASTQIWITYSGGKTTLSSQNETERDNDPYPWIIWYIWKARNDKLFRGIDRDPLELVRYAESECQAWYHANEVPQPVIQEKNIEEPQVLSLGNICLLVDLGRLLLTLVDVDGFRWTVGRTYSLWRPEIQLDANQLCIQN